MEPLRKAWVEKDSRTGNWYVRWRERAANGAIEKKSLLGGKHSHAIEMRDLKNTQLKTVSGLTQEPHAELAPLLEKYIQDRIQIRKLRPGSIELKRVSLNRYIEITQRVGNITKESLIAYRDDLYSALSPATVGIRFREVKAFVRWIWSTGLIQSNPFMNIEMPRQELEPHFLTDEEIVRIESVAAPEFKAIFRMAYLTGMRSGELLAAQWEDISWVWTENPGNLSERVQRAFITVQAATAKTRRSRTIALRQEIVDLIGRRVAGRIFAYEKSSLRWAWLTAKKLAGITDKMRFHDLRHTFCRLYLQGGGTIADLMAITGHQSISMMRVYAHFETRWKAERIDSMNLPTTLTGQITGQIQGTDTGLSVIPRDTQTHRETNKGVGDGFPPSINKPSAGDGPLSEKKRKRA